MEGTGGRGSMRMCDGLSEERTEGASWDASLAKQAPRWGLHARNGSAGRALPRCRCWRAAKPLHPPQVTLGVGGWGALSGTFSGWTCPACASSFPHKSPKMSAFAEHLNDDKRRGKCLVVPSKLG